jgi:hypothetical protein
VLKIQEAKPNMSAERLAQLKQSRAFTVLLINSLTPTRDCTKITLKNPIAPVSNPSTHTTAMIARSLALLLTS